MRAVFSEEFGERSVGEREREDEYDRREKETVEPEDCRSEDVSEHKETDMGSLAAEVGAQDYVGDEIDRDRGDNEEPGDVDEEGCFACEKGLGSDEKGNRDVDNLHADDGNEACDACERACERG